MNLNKNKMIFNIDPMMCSKVAESDSDQTITISESLNKHRVI